MVGKPKPPKTHPDFDDAQFKIRGFPAAVGAVLNGSAVLREAADDGEFSRGGAALEYVRVVERSTDAGELTARDGFGFFSPLRERELICGDEERAKDNLPVVLPYWVVLAISESWSRYIDGPTGKKLGEAFGLEGSWRDGDRRKISNYRRDLGLAVAVLQHRREEQVSLEKTFSEVANQFNESGEVVRKAWQSQGKKVENAARYRGVIE